MRHSYFKRGDSSDAFTDLLFNALLGFAFMFVLAFSLISDPAQSGKVDPKAEVLVTVRWPDGHPDDVDTIMEDAQGNLVWYHNKDSGVAHLDRDDRGTFLDQLTVDGEKILNPINQETISLRTLVPGEYVVNVLHYQASSAEPVPVSVKVEKLNPTVRLVYYDTYELTGSGHELTAVRFTVNPQGAVGQLSTRPKALVVRAAKQQ